ncbi:MAG: hypothetical protein IK997_02270 [Bacilli bacterium]|nr:hypothetical protein [Bacilli bacterium]
MKFNEDDINEEMLKSKSKMYAITTFSIIIAIIVIVFSVGVMKIIPIFMVK